MKKTLVALAVLATASANAGNLYENETTSVKVSGGIDAVAKSIKTKSGGATVTDSDPQVVTFAVAQFDIDHKINDSVTAFGSFELEGDGNSGASTDDVKVGFKGNFGTITLGETGSSYAALEKAELTNEGSDFDVVYNSSESAGNGIRYEVTVVDALALSFDLQTKADDTVDADWAVSAEYTFNDFSIAAAYNQADEASVTYDRNAYGLSGSYEANGFYVAATYTQYKGQGDVNVEGGDSTVNLGDHDGSTMALAGSYSWDAYKVYAAYQVLSADKSTSGASIDADIDNYYLGLEYAVMSNLTAFVEYNVSELSGGSVANKQELDFAAAGFYLSF